MAWTTLKNAFDHPLTAATAAASAFTALFQPGVLEAVLLGLASQAGALFTFGTIGLTLSSWIGEFSAVRPVFIAIAGLAGVIQLARIGDGVIDNIQDRL